MEKQGLAFIGPDYAGKLQNAGIRTPDDLLRTWGDPGRRTGLVQTTGISENLFERWYRIAGFMQIEGVTHAYAELLEKAGVPSLEKLHGFDPAALHRQMEQVLGRGEFEGTLPTLEQVRKWIQSAPVREGVTN